MRYLLCHSWYEYEYNVRDSVEASASLLRAAGIDVQTFCLTLNPPGPCLVWRELDQRWKRRDRELLEMYDRLQEALEDRDVFLNWNGINIHPEFLPQLNTFNVYACFDDPESSEHLSRPVAAAYDLCMVGNAAEVDTYRSWGVRNAFHWPVGFRPYDFDPSLTKEHILRVPREHDLFLCCERESSFRKERLDKISAAFPQGLYFGKGWPNGFLPEKERVPILQNTRIGINIHNSTGPINYRTFYLPANGVLQICDNKSHLGKIFELDKEVVGYDTIEEAIDKVHYYLGHEEERREIAAAGFERAHRDYNEVAVFRRLMKAVEDTKSKTMNETNEVSHLTNQQYWDAMRAPQFHPWKVEPPPFATVLEKYLPVNSKFKCLEIGGYPGGIISWLAKRFEYIPVSIDFSKYCDHIETLFRYNGISDYEVYQGDFFEFEKGPFDVVTSFGFVEHFEDYDSVIRRHMELVKLGGYVVVEVPRMDGLIGHVTRYCFTDEHSKSQFEVHNREIMNAYELERVFKKYGAEILYAGYTGGNELSVEWQRDIIKPEMRWIVYALNALGSRTGQESPFFSPFAIVIARRTGSIPQNNDSELAKLFERADEAVRANDMINAESLLRKAIEDFPGLIQPYLALADLKIAQRLDNDALDILVKAPGELPRTIDVKKRILQILMRNNHVQIAEALLMECLLWLPEDPQLLEWLKQVQAQ